MRRLPFNRCRSTKVWWTRSSTLPAAVAVLTAVFLAALTYHSGAAQQAPGGSRCEARARGSSFIPMVSQGETVQVQTMIGWNCPDSTQPYDLALVADAPSFAGDDGQSARNDTRSLVRRLDLEANDLARLGLVGYGADATWLTALGAPAGQHLDAVHSLAEPGPRVPAGSGGLAAGVREGLKMLAIGRRPPPSGVTQEPAHQGMVVLASPRGEAYCNGLAGELRHASEDDVKVTFVCMEGECEASCLDAFDVRKLSRYAWDIMALEQERLAWQTRLRVEMLDLHDVLWKTLHVVEESVNAQHGSYDDELHRIRWRLDVRHDDDGQFLLVYSVKPQEAGRFPVRHSGHGHLRDTRGQTAMIALPQFTIDVVMGRVFRGYLPWLSREMLAPTPTPPDHTFRPAVQP